MRSLLFVNLLISSVIMVSCGSLGKKYNKTQIDNVKRVAVLSFVIYQDKPKDSLGLGSLTKGVDSSSTSENSPEMKKLANNVYTYLSKKLRKKIGKKVYPLQKVAGTNFYKNFYKRKMEGLRMGGYHGKDVEMVYVRGIIDQTNFQGLDYAKKVQLAKSVGADAFIEFNAFQSIEQGWGFGNLTGNGDFALKTRSNITMYNLRSDEPILRIQNVDGSKSRNSSELGKSYSQMKKLSLIGVESAKSSIDQLMKSFE